MKRKWLCFPLAALFCLLSALPAFASERTTVVEEVFTITGVREKGSYPVFSFQFDRLTKELLFGVDADALDTEERLPFVRTDAPAVVTVPQECESLVVLRLSVTDDKAHLGFSLSNIAFLDLDIREGDFDDEKYEEAKAILSSLFGDMALVVGNRRYTDAVTGSTYENKTLRLQKGFYVMVADVPSFGSMGTIIQVGDFDGKLYGYQANEGRIHTVKAGETLATIALNNYGDYALADEILYANEDVLHGSGMLSAGMRLRLPDIGLIPLPQPGDGILYTVKAGDTLGSIAVGHGTTWQELYEENKAVIADPAWIYEGQILVIPNKQ